MNPVNFIDPSAIVGKNVKVWHFARILAGAVLGEDASIGSGSEVGRGARIGARTRVSANVFIPANTFIGPDVFIGPGVTFTDDKYPVANNHFYKAEPPVVEAHASIGAGAVILPGVSIGRNAVVGAGAIVTKSVQAFTTTYGPSATPRTTPPAMVVSAAS